MWRRTLSKAFSTLPNGPPRPPIWKYAGLGTGLIGLFYLSHQYYLEYLLPSIDKPQKVAELRKTALEKVCFVGVPRETEANEVESRVADSVVVVYHPGKAGKTTLGEFIRGRTGRPTLVLKGKQGLEEMVGQWVRVGKERWTVGVFQEVVAEGLLGLKDPLLILDGVEEMTDVLAERMVMMAYRLKRAGKADAVVLTNSMRMVRMARACED